MTVRLDNGNFIDFDPNDELWQDKESGKIRIQLGYAVSVNASQGMTRDHSFVVDDTRMRRKQVGVAFSRHRDTCRVYVNREERHKVAMLRAEGKDWRSLERFTDGDCVRHMQKTYGREDNKESTLDHDDWKTHEGLSVQPDFELLTLRVDELAERKHRGAGMPELPFQRAASYAIKEPEKLSDEPLRMARSALVQRGIRGEAILAAEEQGFISYANGQPVFNGRRADGELVNQIVNGKIAPGAQRANFPPILRDDDDDIHIVATGEDALALCSRAMEDGGSCPTVVVAAGNVSDATSLIHMQTLLAASKTAPTIHGRMIDPADRSTIEKHLTGAVRRNVHVVEKKQAPAEERQSAAAQAEKEWLRMLEDDEQPGHRPTA